MLNNAGRVLVCGAGGFIGSHLVKRLKLEGFWVRGADLKLPEFTDSAADEFIQGDLRDPAVCLSAVKDVCEVYQLAADMGGAGYIFTGNNDAAILRSSALINLNMIHAAVETKVRRIFYSSSACIYPARNQEDPNQPNCAEESAYPADPDSEYGWEKLFSERVYLAYQRNTGIQVHIARFHNVFGPEGTWQGGREKSPAALCRKVAEASGTESIEIWGDGQQTRSFLFIDECVEGIRGLMNSNFTGPVNIGSEEMISIDNLAYMVMRVAGKHHPINHVDGPLGVRGRNSDNRLISTTLGWAPSQPLEKGIKTTYEWIARQVDISHSRKQNAIGAIGHNRKFAGERVPPKSSKVFTSGNSLS
jgi:GDP-D-mannose 3', 5'-epimerase